MSLSPNTCSMTPKKKEDEFEDHSKELVSSCNQEDNKKIRSLKFFIKLTPAEKKIAEEDEKKTAEEDEKQTAEEDEKQIAEEDEKKIAVEDEKQIAVEDEKQIAVEDEKQIAVEAEKKIAEEDEKQIAVEDEKQIVNKVDERPAAKIWNLRPRRKTNSKYASTVVKEKREFTNSLTKEEIEEDYVYLMGKPPRRRIRRRVR